MALSRQPKQAWLRAGEDNQGFSRAVVLTDTDGYPTGDSGREPGDALLTYLLNGSSSDMAIDGSATAVDFEYEVPAGKRALLNRLMIYMDDATAFASEDFGGITALTNGLSVQVAGEEIANWKDNVDIVTTMFDFVGYPNFGKTTNSGAGRWTMSKSFGGPLQVEAGEKILAKVQDDLTGLVTFRMTAHLSLFTPDTNTEL